MVWLEQAKRYLYRDEERPPNYNSPEMSWFKATIINYYHGSLMPTCGRVTKKKSKEYLSMHIIYRASQVKIYKSTLRNATGNVRSMYELGKLRKHTTRDDANND